MTQTLAIALGGASGALMRFWVSGGIYTLFGRGFPYGTLVVNVLGSLLMGVLFVVLQERVALSPEWRAGLQIGLLGAFTTFSTFSIETLNLLQQGEQMRAMLNVVISVVACIGAAWVGLLLARQL
ncbi:MAG TPA: fluoride efflux transporter CrcB [Chromatiaceae bacterium]|jgi:CrcB protein|nr:fluoride efflux transporter CrcB [Chromatiaceae bacterium]HIB84361.1 fluoride efflux transporter CrcB [Chromatiaceae bacterium]HIN83131.1 fluoride efflux transporter CrcB [Chromatiales bacterium]HIO14151.1 fluoride efflux transporter CrcB [Chromatiales bacterium]